MVQEKDILKSTKCPQNLANSCLRDQKRQIRRSQLMIHPAEITFQTFEIGIEYTKSVQVRNSGKKSISFEILLLPTSSEFKFELLETKSVLIPGMSATLLVYLKARSVSDKSETLCIREENGKTLHVPLRAMRETPILTLTGKDLQFYKKDDMFVFDVGHYLVGTHNKLDFCLEHQGGASRYFVLSDDWRNNLPETPELRSQSFQQLQLTNFTFQLVHFAIRSDSKLLSSLSFHPIACGVCSEKVLILCDNGSRRSITFQGHGTKFIKSYIELQGAQQKMLGISVNTASDMDDSSCEWLCDMKEIFTDKVDRTLRVKNVCQAKNKISYEWRVEPSSCKTRVPLPLGNVTITPSSGKFHHNDTVRFNVSCNIPKELFYQETGFVLRLFCCFSKDSKTDKQYQSREVEENADDMFSLDPSYIIPYGGGTDSVCVANIEFRLDCRRAISVNFNPSYIYFQDPLTLNQVISHTVHLRNECPHQLSCELIRRTNKKLIKMKVIPNCFTLTAFEEKTIILRMKLKTKESFKLTAICLIKENPKYSPILKIQGNTTIGEIELKHHIEIHENIKGGHSIDVQIEFENHINTDCMWQLYNIKETIICESTLQQYFFSKVNQSGCFDCNTYENIKMDAKEENGQTRSKNTCVPLKKEKNNLIGDFKNMFTEMCNMTDEIYTEGSELLRRNCVSTEKLNHKNTDDRSKEDQHMIEWCTLLKLQLASKLHDLNPNRNENDEIEAIYTGYLSALNPTKRRKFTLHNKNAAVAYKLLEIRLQECVQHKLIIADYCSSEVTLKPNMLDIGSTCLNEESTFQIAMTNKRTCSCEYCWGKPIGIEQNQLKIRVAKTQGTLKPQETDLATITVEPLSFCNFQNVYIPCFIKGSMTPLRVSIRLKVEDLTVTVSWKTCKQNLMTFHWWDDRLKVDKITWGGLEVLQLNKRSVYKEESKIYKDHSFSNLENLTDWASSPSYHSVISDIKTKTSEETLAREGSVPSTSLNRLLYSKYRATYNEFLHFENVQYKVPTKKTINISNPTKNCCKFRIQVNYFKPKQNEENVKRYIDPTNRKSIACWDDKLEKRKGLVIFVENTEYEISNQNVTVDVWVYGNTWGLYMDTLTIEFEALPLFYVPVSVAIETPPLRLHEMNCLSHTAKPNLNPIYNFNPIISASMNNSFSISVKNISGVPLKVVWTNCGDMIGPSSRSELPSMIPQQRNTRPFYLENDQPCLMQLKENGGKDKLEIHFNTEQSSIHSNKYLVCSKRKKSKVFESFITGYIWSNPSQVECLGVYRKPTQTYCTVRALAGTAMLKFLRYKLEDRQFWYTAGQIFSSYSGVKKVKTFTVKNIQDFETTCHLSAEPPFSIIKIVIADQGVDLNDSVLLPPKETMAIYVSCKVNKETFRLLDYERYYDSDTSRYTGHENNIVLRKRLQVIYDKENSVTSLPLEVHIVKPSLELSACILNFYKVYLGDTDMQYVTVNVVQGNKDDIQITAIPSPFSIEVLPSESNTKVTICVKFTPDRSQIYQDQFELSTYTSKKILRVSGEGTQNQKYRKII